MVKRKRNTLADESTASSKRKRRNVTSRVTVRVPSRRSLRCKGVSGDSNEVRYAHQPSIRFSRKLYPRPICRMYGLDREIRFKGYFFCSNCKVADEAAITKGMHRRNVQVRSTRTACIAEHRCFAFPTHKKKSYYCYKVDTTCERNSYLMKQRATTTKTVTSTKKKTSDQVHGGSTGDVASSVPSYNTILESKLLYAEQRLIRKNNELKAVKKDLSDALNEVREKDDELLSLQHSKEELDSLILKLNYTMNELRDENRVKLQQVRRDAKEDDDRLVFESTDSLVSTFCSLLADITGTQKANKGRRSAAFADLLWDGSIMGGELRESLRKKVTREIRETIFLAPQLIKKMDECGFTLNLSALGAISSMEKEVNGKYSRGLFPCTKTIQRTMEVVHAFGDNVLPFSLGRFPAELGGGELAKFPQDLVLKALVKSHGLMDKAKTERVGVGYAYDGTKVDGTTYLEISGFKVTDREARDPKSGRVLFGSGLQSSACSFPDMLGIAKDTKEVFEVYKPRLQRINKEAQMIGSPLLGSYTDEHGEKKLYKHIEATSEMDMKTVWMINSTGCAAKQGGNDAMFCSFCPLTNRNIATGTTDLCDQWCQEFNREDHPDWMCHHVKMVTEEHVRQCREDMEEMKSLCSFVGDIETTKPKCHLSQDGDPSMGAGGPQNMKDPHSIHFDYGSGTFAQQMTFMNAVRNDLSVRNLETNGSARDRIERLRTAMVQEYAFLALDVAVRRGTVDREGAATLILNNPPCMLHLEIRVGIKIVTTILQNGLSNALNGNLLTTAQVGNKQKRLSIFTKEVNECFNHQLWGSNESPAFWEMPTEMDRDGNIVLSTLSFGNNRTRKAIDKVESLIDVCLLENERTEWKNCIAKYRDAMVIARSHYDLSDEEIILFQQNIDDFYQQWIKVALGKKGITNYIHLLGSGHISEFLFRWRNLYAHSQQGWEALNSLVKSVYFRCTSRGGGMGKKSKLYAIARWCQRRMLWASGYTFEYMESEVKKHGWSVMNVFTEHTESLPEEDVYYDDLFI